ncbi:uncharacterized protein EDB91DRAFT_1303342 [Suillus paluster]|uniref:uncharacterized protein n=1 Tax=Suillus paluster TaxID=48578 RepID=UPI001B873612|nr:uncharacterized protein EDB91DRAFT_1303342 [Suillus paluster]KAG1750378.1 hypothetical protein EDB91DRAFT_1303342 [Suillus paluster]
MSAKEVESQINAMHHKDVLVYMIRAQNAAVVMRKFESETIFESFEISPNPTAVMGAKGKLICSYPGPAITVPDTNIDNATFPAELANFLVRMDRDVLDAAAMTKKAGSTVAKERDTTHPRYITELLTGILRGLGSIADVPRIRKRIGDDVLWDSVELPWRCSPLWLVIRVALQTTLECCALGKTTYKSFMLFSMARLTTLALDHDLPNDTLHFMSAKIARRLFKLGSSASPELSQMVSTATSDVRSILEGRWGFVQDTQWVSPHWAPETLRVLQDTHLSLNTSREYIRQAFQNQHSSFQPTSFNHSHHMRGTINDFLDAGADFLVAAHAAEPSLSLIDFEMVVRSGIDDWVARISFQSIDSTCVLIEVCTSAYSSRVLKAYEGNPENFSIMLLTLFELWVAMDKIVVRQIPLLSEYSPEIPVTLLEHLLICQSSALDRLRHLHTYLQVHHCQGSSRRLAPSSTEDNKSFAVCYFYQSSKLKSLKLEIEWDAQEEREQKLTELWTFNERYTDLEKHAESLSHEYAVNSCGWDYHKKKSCDKCCMEKEMRIHEDYKHEREAIVVVFELACPTTFDMWRSMTFHILIDVCTPEEILPTDPFMTLPKYGALQKYRQCHPRQRLTLASDAKPFTMCHYSSTCIPKEDDKMHGLADILLLRFDSSKLCTFLLPKGPYNGLQQYLAGMSHMSNEVIANQADCHKDMTIHEFIAFRALQSGPLLQWMNILCELRARVLNFRREEVHLLLVQAISQVGPLSLDDNLVWHEELSSAPFINALLGELECLMASVEGNWLEGITISTIIMLVCRILSTEEESIKRHGYLLLRNIRTTTITLLTQLSGKMQANNDKTVSQDLQGRVHDMAITCRSTFDVDVDGDASLLLTSNDDMKVFAYCAVMIYDNTPSQLGDLLQHSKLLLERDKRCCHALEAAVRQYAELHREGLDCAIAEIWGSYRPGTPWRALPVPNSHWLVTQTAPSCSQSSQDVHFNLPFEVATPLQILDIVPADIPGMEYATRGNVCDHQVSFALCDPNNLIIHTKHIEQDSPILQLILSQQFLDDLPAILTLSHTHWLNLSMNKIEIQPVDNAWKFSPENWILQFPVSGPSTLQNAGGATLVDICSQTWDMVSKRMGSLEDPCYMMVTCSASEASGGPFFSLKVDLPRYGLEFFIDQDGEMQSRNMSNMVVDTSQSTGTMLGLINQLVLHPKSQTADEHPCTVIIPDGRISYSVNGHHVRVTIAPEGTRLTYHSYKVDPDLRCLAGNRGLTSKLYQALLHAVTSGCIPDPLTGRTGTEEALHLLHSAACQSFMKLHSRDTDLLREISLLSTRRIWYPVHLQKMQTVSWSCLASLAQHHGFHPAVKSIMDYGMQLSTFSEWSSNINPSLDPPFPNHLLECASTRASAVYPDQFSLPLALGNTDVIYTLRAVPDKHAEERAFHTAFMVRQWPSRLLVQHNLLDLLTQWKHVQGMGELLSLRYSKDWLQPNFPKVFLSAYDRLRSATKKDMFQLVFTLASVSYGVLDDDALMPTLLAFTTVPEIRSLGEPLKFTSYDLLDGFRPSYAKLDSIISFCARDYEISQERQLPAIPGEDENTLGRRRYAAFEDKCHSEKQVILSNVRDAWPCEDPPERHTLQANCYNVMKLLKTLRPLFQSCWRNHLLKQYLDVLQGSLMRFYAPNPPSKIPSQCNLHSHIVHLDVASQASSVDSQYLFDRHPPVLHMCGSSEVLPDFSWRHFVSPDSGVTARLQLLINDFRDRGSNKFRRDYANHLDQSRSIFCEETSIFPPDSMPYTTDVLLEYHSLHSQQFEGSFTTIVHTLSPTSAAENALYNAGLWPRITPNFLFTCMASVSPNCLGNAWLLVFAAKKNWVEFFKELENEECEGFDPEQYTDWLLIQIESQFSAQPIQVKVALEMMSPCTGRNTSLQLNMGEGKSYVIVPLAAAALSDGHKLVRVIVLKSLSAQMFQLLVERLSGLAQRHIFYIPFSRVLSIDASKVQMYCDLMQECMDTRGILVVQPDHILSFQLMAVDRQLSLRTEAAKEMLQAQLWLDNHTRDILDESDEILHVHYQLVYTVGLQWSLQGHPERWTTTQQVLTLVVKHAARLLSEIPSHLKVSIHRHGVFPFIRVLHHTAGEELVQWIAQDVIDGALDNISFNQASLQVKQAVRQFIAVEETSDDCIRLVEDHCRDTTVWPGLLVLRGLLACSILVYTLKERRWRVDYGLAQERTMLAIPFRAKDMPSLRAEFGHPDIAVTLTCLSYYYAGLTLQQLMLCFKLLQTQDNPALEYESWVHGLQSVPDSLLHLSIFPKEAKGFPSKLACSGWDLVQEKRHLTTGFSGTNDNRYLLLSSMVQHELDYQWSTNTRVLAFLLCPENNCYRRIPPGQKVKCFIYALVTETPEVRVLLDVGAQMLELKNQELAEAWLRAKRDAKVAVFVNDNDELVIISRDGTVKPLVSSSFAQQLDQCMVYLDDAHTRGTDVKLPSGSRAAVMLGPKVTKDRLTQGCMRMRKLGNGHSVMFFAPTEVDRGIRSATQKADADGVNVVDILHWAMLETCLDIEIRRSHWVQQRSEFNARNSAWAQFSRTPTSISTLKTAWLQPEECSLEDMYAPCRKCKEPGVLSGVLSTRAGSMDEEQEREVVHKVQTEHHPERPSRVESAAQSLHVDVHVFLKTSRIPVGSSAFIPVLSSLVDTTAEFHEHKRWEHNILVTCDFARTVGTLSAIQEADHYLRPVNWIVSSNIECPVLVVMSPNKVNALLPDICRSNAIHLCIYTPRTTKTMQPCDDLRLYCVPSTPPLTSSEPLIFQLNLFAGQLYFFNYDMYLRTCNFLGLKAPDLGDVDLIADSDGFISEENRPAARASCSFKRSQLSALKELFGMRRKGMGYLLTHLGKMLNGRILTGEDFLD